MHITRKPCKIVSLYKCVTQSVQGPSRVHSLGSLLSVKYVMLTPSVAGYFRASVRSREEEEEDAVETVWRVFDSHTDNSTLRRLKPRRLTFPPVASTHLWLECKQTNCFCDFLSSPSFYWRTRQLALSQSMPDLKSYHLKFRAWNMIKERVAGTRLVDTQPRGPGQRQNVHVE